MIKHYWDNVPRGIWSVVDPTDTINALHDEESVWVLDKKLERLYIRGPVHKGLIVDLKQIKENLEESEWITFIEEIREFVPEV